MGKRQKYQNPIDADTMMRKYAYSLRLLLALVLASGIFVAAAPMQMEAKETQAYTTQDLNEQLVMATLWM
ncbi:MAG: hypothetical protein VX560_12150 [SAR324 cluster bacterium]|nr:hypothetical protein [SAR324 cluster bacterium]